RRDRRRRARDVRGAGAGGGAGAAALRPAVPPVHVGAPRLAAAARPGRRAAPSDPRPAAVAPRPAARLPLPPALRVRDGGVQGAGARARRGRGRGGARRPLPPRPADEGPRGEEAARGRAHAGRVAAAPMAVPAAAENPPLAPTGDELLVVDDLRKHFPVTRGIVFQKQVGAVKAVDGVSFSLREGETLGIVGESGCGTSTLARCITRLLEPTGGRVVFRGRDITRLTRRELRPVRRELMMVFQDPYASLNARKRVGFIVGEALEVHR